MTAVHSRTVSTDLISHDANTAVTARLAAMMTCTSKSGRRRHQRCSEAQEHSADPMLQLRSQRGNLAGPTRRTDYDEGFYGAGAVKSFAITRTTRASASARGRGCR